MKELMEVKTLSLVDIRQREGQVDGDGILDSPPLYQIVVAAAFQAGNRSVVRDFIETMPPPEGTPLLFSGTQVLQCRFGDTKGFGHGALDGRDDNACDILDDLIKSGCASPHRHMWDWPFWNKSFDAGKALGDVLDQYGLECDNSQLVSPAVATGNCKMLEHIL